jgi:Rod binding domain-containing protein
MITYLNANPNSAPFQPPYSRGISYGAQAVQAPSGSGIQKLTKAAQEFEGILLSTLLEEFQKSSLDPSDASQGAGSETLRSLGTQAVAQALAARGGLGIARMIVHHFGG